MIDRKSIWVKVAVAFVLMMASQASLKAQRMALTSNLLEDAVLTPNVGLDIVVADKSSLTFDVSYAPWKLSQKFRNKHMAVRAGYRYWFSQALYAHYVGVDAVVSSSDVQAGRFGSRDEYVGLGIGYGYSFIINERWNIVPGFGIGMAYGSRYEGTDMMLKPNEGVQATSTTGFIPILTRLSVTIQYVIK